MSNRHTKNPLFCIITATYNRAHLLPRAINSVLNQSYQNFQLIIIDDGATDNTGEVVKSFLRDGRITYYKYEENRGLSAVWNKGLDLAKGDYIAFLDDDDELLPDALETAANKFVGLSQAGVKVIWFDCMDFVTRRLAGKAIRDDYVSYEDHLCEKVSGDFWMVIERGLFGESRFEERAWGGNATLLWLKIFYKAKNFHVSKVLYLTHREHGSTVSRDFRITVKHKKKLLWGQKTFVQKYGQQLKSLCPRIYGAKLASLGLYHLLNGEKAEGRRALLKSLRFHIHFKTLVLILLSFLLNERQIAFLGIEFVDMRSSFKKLIQCLSRSVRAKVQTR